MSGVWKKYKDETEILAKRMVLILRKRELLIITTDDSIVIDTLTKEFRDCVEEILVTQDKLKQIYHDPQELLKMVFD